MKKLPIAIFIISLFSCNSKKNECSCPDVDVVMDRTPFKIFKFSNGKSVAITSAPDSSGAKPVYREFGIYECGADSLTRFYHALEPCLLDFRDDSFFVNRQELLAIGKDFRWVDTTWLIDKYYYKGKILKMHKELPHHLHYNDVQIKQVLAKFNATEWKTQAEIGADSAEEMLRLANTMMIAAISGSDSARQNFKQFKQKFKPDGYLHEWYNNMQDMIDTIETVTKRNKSDER